MCGVAGSSRDREPRHAKMQRNSNWTQPDDKVVVGVTYPKKTLVTRDRRLLLDAGEMLESIEE